MAGKDDGLEGASWNFTSFEKYIDQRFTDLALQLRERYEAQQIGVTAALAAAEKAVNAALIAAEKAVDKAEAAQQLRNDAQNEFRKSLSDLSGMMWMRESGQTALESTRREFKSVLEALEAKTDDQYNSREARVNALEKSMANFEGRVWAISAVFAVVALMLNVAFQFFRHLPK